MNTTNVPPLPRERECQPCTACCDGWVQINIEGFEAWPGHPCPHSTGKGCDDYENRPHDPCRVFDCAWKQGDPTLPDSFRPEECGALVMNAVTEWRGRPVDLAVPVGREIPTKSLDILMARAMKRMRPLLYQVQDQPELTRRPTVLAFGPPEFQQYVTERQNRGLTLW